MGIGRAHAIAVGDAGVKGLAREDVVLSALKENVKESGVYFFPAPDATPGMSKEQRQEAMRKAQKRWRTEPRGIMVFHPNGTEALSLRKPLTQLGTDVLAMLLGVFLLTRATALTGFRRVPFLCHPARHLSPARFRGPTVELVRLPSRLHARSVRGPRGRFPRRWLGPCWTDQTQPPAERDDR